MVRKIETTRRALLAGAGTLLGAGCLGVDADHTPSNRDDDWRMYGRDPGRTRFVPDVDLPRDGVDVAWEHSTGASNWRPPLVANGTVYCQYSNGLFVLDSESGEGTRSDTHGGFGRGTGPMAFGSTTIYRDGVLVVSYGHSMAGYAADPDDWPEGVSGLGERRARWWIDDETVSAAPPDQLSSEQSWLASPLVADDAVISLHASSSVSAAETDDGTSRWRYDLEGANLDDEYSVVALGHVVDIDSETVVVKTRLAGAPLLVGIDLADGTLEWTVDEGPASERVVEDQDSLAARDGTVYTVDGGRSSREFRLLELDAATGERGWSESIERSSHAGIALDDSTLYHVGTNEAEEGHDPLAIVAIDLADGGVRWETELEDSAGSTWAANAPPPTVAGEHLLVPGPIGIHAMDRTSGDELWTFTRTVGTSGGSEIERAAKTPAVVTDDRIVIGTTLALYGLE